MGFTSYQIKRESNSRVYYRMVDINVETFLVTRTKRQAIYNLPGRTLKNTGVMLLRKTATKCYYDVMIILQL